MYNRHQSTLILFLLLLLASCGATQQVAQPSPVAPAPTVAGPTAVPTPGPGQFANPVINQNFPDPDVLKVGDMYYAYATNAGTVNIQTASSRDLVHWKLLDNAL